MPKFQTQEAFLTEDFLLQSDFAKALYHDHASHLPIIDYHNHLPPAEINSNKKFENISKLWLAGDHYKWRAMRTLGISERYITGEATDLEKFKQWGKAVPYTLRNPLYHWTHLELKRYFGIEEQLSATNAEDIFHQCNVLVASDDFSTQSLLAGMQVETVCTTDDPVDDLSEHVQFYQKNADLGLYPAFRPDKSYGLQDASSYKSYLYKLEEASKQSITSYTDLLQALSSRVDYFHQRGCRLSDHGLEHIQWLPLGSQDPDAIFAQVMAGKDVSLEAQAYFRQHTLIELAKMYHAKGWVMQFHLGALRNTNSRAFRTLGPDTGFDSIGDFDQASGLSRFLNHLDSSDQLCKTILYNLNPRDNEVFATMVGNFSDGSVKGKIQYGSGWWYLDQKDGMENQLNTLSNMGILSCFIGMLTDSRSFLSFPRHEYFRRILCNLIGKDVEQGLLPWDEKWLGKIVADICYHNAKQYFDFNSSNFNL